MVAEAAPGGDMIQGKVPAAQDDVSGSHHLLAAAFRVLGVVLVVTVHGNDTDALGAVFQEVAERIFQGSALALVDLMVQQGDLGMLSSQIGEIVQIFCLGAVVYQNDIGKSVFQQAIHNPDQLLIGIQGGQHHRDFG